MCIFWKDLNKKAVSELYMLNKKGLRKKIAFIIRDIIILLIFIALIGVLLVYLEQTFESPRQAADTIRGLGAIGPLVVIAIITLEVVVAPIPGYLIAIASGYAFGGLLGAVYTYIGNIIGTAIAFSLSQRFGRPLVEKLIRKKKLDFYDSFFQEHGKIALWLGFLFPVFPSDIIAFATGLSDMKFRDFMFIVSIAYIPNMLLLNYFGAAIYESGFSPGTIFFGAFLLLMLVISFIVYLFWRKRIERKS